MNEFKAKYVDEEKDAEIQKEMENLYEKYKFQANEELQPIEEPTIWRVDHWTGRLTHGKKHATVYWWYHYTEMADAILHPELKSKVPEYPHTAKFNKNEISLSDSAPLGLPGDDGPDDHIVNTLTGKRVELPQIKATTALVNYYYFDDHPLLRSMSFISFKFAFFC